MNAREASHLREPNRFRGDAGAARAAEAAGDRNKAAAYYAKLIALATATVPSSYRRALTSRSADASPQLLKRMARFSSSTRG